MSALVDSLQMATAGPRRWFLVRHINGATAYTWTRAEAEATRFSDEEAERLAKAIRDGEVDMPMLPTQPEPTMPIFVRVCHGGTETPAFEPPIKREREPAPTPAPSRIQPAVSRKPSPPTRTRHVEPDEAYRILEQRHLD